jgi:hypothetical protein
MRNSWLIAMPDVVVKYKLDGGILRWVRHGIGPFFFSGPRFKTTRNAVYNRQGASRQ